MRYVMFEVVHVTEPWVMWVVPEEFPLKGSISWTCVLQTVHFEVHLNVPNLVGGVSKGGISARTISHTGYRRA